MTTRDGESPSSLPLETPGSRSGLEQLIEEWRATAKRWGNVKPDAAKLYRAYADGVEFGLDKCADELEALLRVRPVLPSAEKDDKDK